MLEKLLTSKGFAFDCETTSESGKKKDNLHFKRNEIVCMSFAENNISFSLTTAEIMKQYQVFKELMTNPKYKKIGHNLKFDAKCVTGQFSIKVDGLFYDTHIASCLLNENEPHGLKALCKKYLGTEWGEWSKEQTIEELLEYCRLDSVNTWKLALYQKPKLQQQRLDRLNNMEVEVLNVFYNSECRGVHIELDYLKDLSTKYGRYIQKIVNWIYRHTQEEFNINSSK
ncbi:hypothetical protein QUF70_18810, partial [Desulfobacterales bacterium HSG17]|nr:hypothetical protein [Desulfobacterales bacterium HSG17]